MTTSNVSRSSVQLAAMVLAACVVRLVAKVQPAEAPFPGKHGKIAFMRNSDIFTMDPDGPGIRKLACGLG